MATCSNFLPHHTQLNNHHNNNPYAFSKLPRGARTIAPGTHTAATPRAQQEELCRRTMASLHGMPYSTSEFSPHENKAAADLFWLPESPGKPAPADFLDEFVVLDGGDSTTTSTTDGGEGGGLASAITPPAVSMPAGRHVNIVSAVAMPSVKAMAHSGRQKQEPDQQQCRQGRGGHPMDAHHMDMIDMGGLPLHYHDMLGTGSISDSELLKLEGLSMRSPHVHVPPSSASMPPSPPSMSRSASPRKAGRLEALYTRARNKVANFQAKPTAQQQQPQTVAPSEISRAQMGPAKSSSRPRPTGNKAPLSPPLTASMPEGMSASLTSTDAGFINGFISDPFADARMHNGAMPNTPLHTPLMNGSFDANGTTSINPWDTPTPDMAHSFNGAPHPGFWWGDPFASQPNNSMPHLDMEMDIDDPEFFNTSSTTKLPMAAPHHQSFSSSSTSNLSLSGLMIHMPQPRGGPPPAVLHPPRYHYPPPPPIPSSANGPATSPRRLTKAPRAPSSGARRHHYPPPPQQQQQQQSPRKPRTASGGAGPSVPSSPTAAVPSRLHRRSASMQMLRSTGGTAAAAEPSTPSSAIRKRKSWTGRRTSSHHHQQHLENTLLSAGGSPRKPQQASRRTPSLPAMGSSYHHGHGQHHPHYPHPQHPQHNHGENEEEDEEEEELEDGFVNYTPQDHRVLMTGVAPSGSSKTKARREREAQEQKRKLGEAVRKAVAAAGGDVRKLEEGGWDGVGGLGMGILEGGQGGRGRGM